MKIISWLRWFFVVFFIGIFGILTAWLFYPLWNLTHWKVFWIWEDSTKYKDNGFQNDYKVYIEQHGGKETFKVKYKWHVLRNRIWNLNSLFTPKQGAEKIKKIVIDKLYRDGKKVVIGGEWVEIAGLKYKAKEGQDPWQVNRGDEIDFKYSNIGTSFIYYTIRNKLYFRYSTCRNIWKYWITLKLGTDNKRFILTFKLQR